jgi:hypothetical protein
MGIEKARELCEMKIRELQAIQNRPFMASEFVESVIYERVLAALDSPDSPALPVKPQLSAKDVIPTDWEPDGREPLMEKIGCYASGFGGSGFKLFEGKSVKDGDVLAYNKGVLFRVGNNSKETLSEPLKENLKKPLLTDEEKETDVCICGHTRQVHTCENESVMTACELASKCDCGEFKLKPKPLLTDEEIGCWFEFWISELERVGAVAGAKRARDFYETKRLWGQSR